VFEKSSLTSGCIAISSVNSVNSITVITVITAIDNVSSVKRFRSIFLRTGFPRRTAGFPSHGSYSELPEPSYESILCGVSRKSSNGKTIVRRIYCNAKDSVRMFQTGVQDEPGILVRKPEPKFNVQLMDTTNKSVWDEH
jgi:hypothetical protein